MKKKFRQLVIDGKTYLWRYVPGYIKTGDAADPWQCRDLFAAYLQHAKKCPLQIHFNTWEDALVGGPLRTGDSMQVDSSEISGINLHTPGDAARLIRQALKAGWEPEHGHQPFVIEHGEKFLIAIGKREDAI